MTSAELVRWLALIILTFGLTLSALSDARHEGNLTWVAVLTLSAVGQLGLYARVAWWRCRDLEG
jgi:hypothetical protein